MSVDAAIVLIALVAFFSGACGALLGLGGALFVTPFLTLVLHVDIRVAIGGALVSTIATSSGAGARYLKESLANIRVATFLEIGTSAGALAGALLITSIPTRFLFLLFSVVLAYSSFVMVTKKMPATMDPAAPTGLSVKLRMDGTYSDLQERRAVAYSPGRPLWGLGIMVIAGLVSALLGIGSGSIKVPALDLVMHLPLKVATSTSNVMIGVTAAASAMLYFFRGDIDPLIAGPVAIGILGGAFLGARLLPHVPRRTLRYLFVIVLVGIACQMGLQGLRP